MVEPASISNILPLEARPPTPPRESERKEPRSSFLGRLFSKEISSRRSSSSHLTPPDSSLESPNTTSISIRKKVGWADSADYNEPPLISFEGERLSLQPLPPSAERKPKKSILKAHNASQEQERSIGTNTKLLPPHHHATFATMLESIVQQLAGSDRTSKIDAYLMLSSSLKASDNVPDIKALRNKMSLLCQFITQDLSSKVENGKPDSALIVNAIMLLASFLQKGAISESLPLEFQINIVEYTIKAFTDGSASKEVMRHLMFISAQQNFSVKTMNQERVVRLIHALHNVENQVKGKSIITGRLQAYRNLLRRSKAHMMSNTLWIEDLFVDMRSSIKDIRNSAITFGLEASFQLGTESSASRAISDLFKVEHSEGTSFAEFYAAYLKTMIKKKDEGPAVPQIWSVIMLFLRAKPQLYEQWTHMKLFLDVLSSCWNSSDLTIKNEANYAWNRFIFAVQLNEKTPASTRFMLLQPLLSQIKQRKSQAARKSALNSIYHLLYYAFSPISTPTRLDLYWDEYVTPLMKALIPDDVQSTSEVVISDINEACSILRCLFDTTTQRSWSENRVLESPQRNLMNAKELPALDAKWLRNRISRVSSVLSLLLEKVYWDLGGDDSSITRLWQAYVRNIALPAQMEVKVSIDTMNCIASLFGTLHRIWTSGRIRIASLPQSTGPHGPNTTAAFLRSFEKILSTTIEGLGPLAFTEKLLSISQNTFIAVATPSHHPKKVRVEIKCPLYHLLLLLMNPSPDLEYDQRFSSMVHRILLPFFEARKSSRSKREFVKDLFNLLPAETTGSCRLIWQVLAEFASLAIDLRDKHENGKYSEEPLGSDYREIIKILEAGITFSSSSPLPGWKVLFEALVTSATLDAGDAGRALAIVEPMARILLPKDGIPPSLPYLHILLVKASYPKDRQALDAARKRLWGFVNSTQKVAAFDPYSALYEYLRRSLEYSYASFSKSTSAIYSDIIAGTANLLSRCPRTLLLAALVNTQEGIAKWIADIDSRLSGGNELSQSILSLWAVVGTSISHILQTQPHTKVLKDLETLISSGLESKHRTIVNSTLRSWNSTFGSCEDVFEYPDRIKFALVKLNPVADILLPFFPHSLDADMSADQAQRIEFAETQDDTTYLDGVSSMELDIRPAQEPTLSPMTRRNIRHVTPQVIISSLRSSSSKRSREPVADVRGRKLRKRDTTPKARHDDSQVEFEAVPSSPIADRVVDSQLLTEKQKETRERQLLEAAMFPDLRSSPRIRDEAVQMEVDKDPELPLHKSTSRPPSMHLPEAPSRQTTPMLVMPSDDDQFIISSPTPTRPVRDDIELEDPPSSPPESAIKKRSVVDEEISSSPPKSPPKVINNMAMAFEHPASSREAGAPGFDGCTVSSSILGEINSDYDENTSLDPSAQINPYAVANNPTLSTWETVEESPPSSPADDPSDQLRADASQHHAEINDEQRAPVLTTVPSTESVLDIITQVNVFDAVDDTEIPGAPEHIQQESPLSDKTARTPQDVSAPASPSSSDIHDIGDEVFEDAISSPRLRVEKTTETNSSSPLSEIDERSMMRIMAEFDQAPDQPIKQVSFTDEKENDPRNISAAVVSSSVDAASPMRRYALRRSTNVQKHQEVDNEKADITHQLQTSSIPSLIPETPGPKPAEATTKYFDDEGTEIDIFEAIIVDTSRLEDERPLTAKRRAGRPFSKKRKRQDIAEDFVEVPDSHDVLSQLEGSPRKMSPSKKGSPAKKDSPAKKRQKGPHKRGSQVRLETENTFEGDSNLDFSQIEPESLESAQPHENQVFLSEDVSMEEPFENQVVSETVTFLSKSPPRLDNAETMEPLSKPIDMGEKLVEISQTTNNVLLDETDAEMLQVDNEPGVPEAEVIEETTIDDTMVENSSSAPAKPEIGHHEEVMSDTSSEVVEPESSAPPGVDKIEQNVQEQPGFAAGLIESIKVRLRSVVGDLGLLGLGRRDTLELEDLFMDGKRALYQAESRGR